MKSVIMKSGTAAGHSGGAQPCISLAALPNNRIKRAIKTSKLYFLDTGLAAYLTRWNTVDVLKNRVMAGAFFGSFVIAEIIKNYYNKGILELPL